jgi:3-keto-5-aminohexanoate cleavage enzyme
LYGFGARGDALADDGPTPGRATDGKRKRRLCGRQGKGENNVEKLIITAAICGAEVTKENNPAVPYTVAEIAREAKSACDAGASIIHLHVREDDGTPTQSKERFQLCIDAIRRECGDAVIQPSTGGAVGMSDLERLQSTEVTPTPEFATLDCGTLNFGGDEIFVNSDNTIFNFARIMKERGIKPELEVFDKGMIDIAMKADRKGLLVRPLHFDFVLGVQMTATVRDLSFMAGSIPQGSTWTVAGIGRHAFEMAAAGIIMGGHVRVGFEDNLYLEKGVLAQSNGELVEKVVKLAKLLGREIASPAEARGILGL